MNYKGHITVGIITFLLTFLLLTNIGIPLCETDAIIGFFACIFGSLAPDLDIKSSKIHRWAYRGAVFAGISVFAFLFCVKNAYLIHALVWSCIVVCVLASVVFLLSKLKHRGFTHHAPGFIMFVVCMFLVLYLIKMQLIEMQMPIFNPSVVTLFGAIGYLSHILADFL